MIRWQSHEMQYFRQGLWYWDARFAVTGKTYIRYFLLLKPVDDLPVAAPHACLVCWHRGFELDAKISTAFNLDLFDVGL